MSNDPKVETASLSDEQAENTTLDEPGENAVIDNDGAETRKHHE